MVRPDCALFMTRVLRLDTELTDDAAIAREVLGLGLMIALAFAAMTLVARLA